jgi:hypothetical protein
VKLIGCSAGSLLQIDMAERGRGRARDASDLPPEVLSALPSDPYEQIEISKKIVGMAVASRLSQLEKETEKLRGKLGEKEEIVHDLENRVRELEQALHDSSSRLSQALDEQVFAIRPYFFRFVKHPEPRGDQSRFMFRKTCLISSHAYS